MSTLRRLVALALVTVLAATAAQAEDVVRLADGSEVRGEIVRELDGHVWIRVSVGGISRDRFIAATDVSSIERDASGAAPEASPSAATPAAEGDAEALIPGVPRAAVISLEGEVGLLMTDEKLRELIPILEEEVGDDGSGIVVFKIDSGGGFLLELQPLSDVIEFEYKPRFRVAAWVESAISAAAMTAHCIEEIYFMPEGNYGACTGWSGEFTAVSGLSYEQVLFQMEQISARGGYDERLMKAMQGHPDEGHFEASFPLSATIDDLGRVTYFQTEDAGEIVVNPLGEVLTLNSVMAERLGFSKGTAQTVDELTRLLGYDELNWVGKSVEGRIYPVGRAEAEMIDFRERVMEDQRRLGERQVLFEVAMQAAQGANEDTRGIFIGRARQQLNAIVRTVRENPNHAWFTFGQVSFEDFMRNLVEPREEALRELAARD